MVDKTTPRLGLPQPFLTNPLKIDVGKLSDALLMIDANAVMLNDWDIAVNGWQKMGSITNLAQGKIGISLMVVTGSGFANIIMQTGDGSVTTIGDPARISVTAQTNLGPSDPTILGGKLVETSEDTYEVWFNLAPATAPRKWTGLLIAGNGAKIDWTTSTGSQPAGGVEIIIARSLTALEFASDSLTTDGAIIPVGLGGLASIGQDFYNFAAKGDTIISHVWRVNETMRVKAADATTENGFPAGVTGAGAASWRIKCEGINEDRSTRVFTIHSEGATPTWGYRATRSSTAWSVRRTYTSDNPPSAADVKAVPVLAANTNDVINLNDRILPEHYGVMAIGSAAGAVIANNYPYNEIGQLVVLPFGNSGGVTQMYVTLSGRIAARSYNGATFTEWRKTANSGENDDITKLKSLSGPLTLGGDAVSDQDAVTLKQLKSSSGGSGPTINGVLNNFIGSVEWFNGSRAKLPAGYIPADGQLVSRTAPATVDLWAAVSAGLYVSVTDALWMNAGGTDFAVIKNRAKYSMGDGSTNFRVPDLNGVETQTPSGLFLRGSGKGTIGAPGDVYINAAPNIIGSTGVSDNNGNVGGLAPGSGAFVTQNNLGKVPTWTAGAAVGTRYSNLNFDASQGNQAYGRESTSEVRPNHAVGIWIIRAGGSFTAANSNFNVYNGSDTAPGANFTTLGGNVSSVYQIGGVDKIGASLLASALYNTTESNMVAQAVIQPRNIVSGISKNFVFDTNGDAYIPRYLRTNSIAAATGNTVDISSLVTCGGIHATAGTGCGMSAKSGGEDNSVEMNNQPGTIVAGAAVNWVQGKWYSASWMLLAARASNTTLSYAALRLTPDGAAPNTYKELAVRADGSVTGPGGVIQAAGSDIALKDNVKEATRGALSRVRQIITREFDWKSTGRHDRGYIAQEIAKVDPIYTYEYNGVMNVSQNALIADLIESVKELAAQVENLKN